MKKSLLLGVALATLAFCAPASAELKFKPGEDKKFHWENFDELKKVDLKGETLTVFGPWRGEDEGSGPQRARLFHRGDRRRDEVFLVGELRAADRHRHAGRQPAQHRRPAAAGPDPGSGLEGPADAARRRHRQLDQGKLRRRPVLGRSRHLQRQGRQARLLRLPVQGRREVAGLVFARQFRGGRLRGPQDPGRAGRARAEDHRRRRQALVHRPGFGRRDRLAGDRLGRRHHAAHPGARRLRQVDQERDSVHRSGRSSSAIDIFAKIATDDKMVDGGAQAVAATDFRDSPKGLFAVPPKCYLHHQASFIPTFFPEGTKLGEDADFFYYPALCRRSRSSATRCSAPARWS